MKNAPPNLERIFAAIPALYSVYDLEWNVVAATDALLASVKRSREELIGRNQFEAFPDNPDDPDASGNATMLAAFERVLAEKAGHTLPEVRYDVADENGHYKQRWWRPLNEPVFGPEGEIEYIIHGLVDVTTEVTGK